MPRKSSPELRTTSSTGVRREAAREDDACAYVTTQHDRQCSAPARHRSVRRRRSYRWPPAGAFDVAFAFAFHEQPKFKNAGQRPAVHNPTQPIRFLVSRTQAAINSRHRQECLCYSHQRTTKMKTRTASPSRLTKLAASAAITLVAILILAAPAHAQHTATLTWTNSVDTPQTNIYRAAGQCPTSAPTGFTKLNSTPVTTGTFADATPLIGLSCYYVTATSNGSSPSHPPSYRCLFRLRLPPPSKQPPSKPFMWHGRPYPPCDIPGLCPAQ